LAHDADLPAAPYHFSLQVCEAYLSLMQGAPAGAGAGADRGLGGQLFWAGELDPTGCALVVGGNIAGAATLAATSDRDAGRRAVREGVADFLVTSLDEAVRVLKNEVRKRTTVAVCVGAPPAAVEREMVERGLRPDCFRAGVLRRAATVLTPSKGAADRDADPMGESALVAWKVDSAPARWMPRLDTIALDCLEPHDMVARRWVFRLGRYLGRLGQGVHLVWSTRRFGSRLIEQVRDQANLGTLNVRGQIEVIFEGASDRFFFGSPAPKGAGSQG
jgi:hypothetical protein